MNQVVGSIAVVLGVTCFFILPSGPGDAQFLTQEEILAAVWRIARNQTGIKHGKVLKYQIYEALRDFRLWCLVQQFTTGLTNGALAGYYSAFLRALDGRISNLSDTSFPSAPFGWSQPSLRDFLHPATATARSSSSLSLPSSQSWPWSDFQPFRQIRRWHSRHAHGSCPHTEGQLSSTGPLWRPTLRATPNG